MPATECIPETACVRASEFGEDDKPIFGHKGGRSPHVVSECDQAEASCKGNQATADHSIRTGETTIPQPEQSSYQNVR
jgi:hypothetical protein